MTKSFSPFMQSFLNTQHLLLPEPRTQRKIKTCSFHTWFLKSKEVLLLWQTVCWSPLKHKQTTWVSSQSQKQRPHRKVYLCLLKRCARIFMAALFLIAKTSNSPNAHPRLSRQINKLWHIPRVDFWTTMSMSNQPPHTTIYRDEFIKEKCWAKEVRHKMHTCHTSLNINIKTKQNSGLEK